jgi:two-component system cell cycle sensor histidine kinase/response regulator CckA
VSHSMKLLKRVIGEDIDVVLLLDPALGRVKVDPIHIDQVIMNLVVNAGNP